ncbi:sporulation-specific protein 15 [Ooceraea biroi]|uniref:sporulation-specific protein 15 n=1 Tax=Ooceraea biroi TaxID=2015173 RepID=UPI000F0908BE|nr:sporulation-specific protein 15 [Ooceraea biroi]
MQSVAASSADDVSMLVKRDQNCQAADENAGEPCGETGGLRILDDFRKLYESRIEKIDRESAGESDRVSMKLQIMSDWIKDLGEQNAMLVHTVEDLEQTACSRVKLLEEKLKQSSQMVVDNLAISNHSEKTLNTLSNRVSQLEKDEEYLQQKIEYLQSDIRGLLEVIRRARRQNIWSLEGITFFEIQPEDIPISVDCVCGQEQVETEYIKSLNLQVGQLQENEKRLTRSHLELEGKIADLTTELLIKDETIKKYVSRLQCFCEKLKEHAKQTNQVISHPLTVTDQDCNIILIPDILESVLDAKDTENQSLRRQLQDIESKLMVHTYENNIDTNNLRIQLEEKCKRIQELEDKVACLEKETVDTRDTLTAEIATLEKQNYHANIGNLLKDDLIKEMRKGLKQATLEDMPSRKVCIDTSNFPERCSLPSIDTSPPKKDEFITFLNSTKVHVQKECDILSDLKFELGKFVEKLAVKDNETNACIISNNCTKENKMCASAMSDKLVNCIEIITKMYSEREKEITLFDCMMKKEQNHCTCGESKNIKSYINRRQFKLMEEYRICTVEVQAATEDIREEISTVLSSFNSRHQNYEELSEVVTAVQSHLVRTREGLVEAINRLELQEEERLRHSERIINGKLKLKDIKNEINQAQSEFSHCINGLQENTQEYKSGNTEGCIANDLLAVIMEEIEQILTNLQLFQTQGNCVTSILKELKGQICTVDCSLKDLQKRTGEVLVNNEIAKTTFCQRENSLTKLEEEVDCTHTKMQDVLETLLSTKQEEEQSIYCTFDNQEVNDIIKMKEELHKLKKEYNDLKLNMIQQTCQMKHDEKLNKWKNRVIDLEDQIRMLQHEVKCKQEANNFLKNSIQSTERELMAARKKADCYRQSHSRDSMELKKKITELENIIKTQREVENDLRKNLNNVANMKKSAEISNAFHMEYNTEALLRCDYPSKHENISHLFKIVQDTMQSAKLAVQEFESDLKKLIREESSLSSVSAKSVMTLTESLGKCREKLDMCSHELSKLKSAVYSKEKLLENMEEVIRIQRDSLTMSQAEVKDLHQKLQEKIDKQNLVIAQYERDKNELTKQNELQIQTIGHLQNAVVEAKRNLDQMGHKAMSDLCKKDETIRQLAMCIDETQDQYNECFTEVTNQDLLLDLQRDAIDTLHKRIHCLEYDKKLIATTIHTIYYSVLSTIQEQIYDHVKDLRELKWKMNSFMETKNLSDGKYMSKSCTIYFDKNCDTQDLEYSSDDMKCETSYMEKYSDKEVILSELNASEYEMLVILCDRVYSLKTLLQEKSDNMVKLQADYELLKNENAILKKQSDVIEIQTKDDILKLKKMLKETRLKLRETENNHQRMIENFDKVQEQLMSATKQEAESKESLTVMEKDYCSKIGEIENEAANLRNLVDKLNEELEETKRKLTLKDVELCQTQDTCKSYADHLNTIRQDLEKEKEEVTKAENINRDLIQQLQDYINDNYHLGQQKFSLEQDNSTYATELQSMRKSLHELRRECHLKEQSLTCMSADLTEAAVSRSELCKESQYILSCVRDCLEQQKKYSETLAKTLENKQQLLMQLIFEKKTLLIKMKKLKRINLLAQKPKRTHRQLTSKTIRKHVNGYISPSDTVRQNADASPIPSSNYTDLYKKCFMQPIKTGQRRVSTCGDSWWFPKMEHVINEVRKSNQWWNENFSNETESDISLEESRDYGYQSSSTSK